MRDRSETSELVNHANRLCGHLLLVQERQHIPSKQKSRHRKLASVTRRRVLSQWTKPKEYASLSSQEPVIHSKTCQKKKQKNQRLKKILYSLFFVKTNKNPGKTTLPHEQVAMPQAIYAVAPPPAFSSNSFLLLPPPCCWWWY